MANKFQKSVLERLEQESTRSKKGQKQPLAKAQPRADSAQIADPPVAPESGIGRYLRREPQRIAKNKTFYLDQEVIEALKAAAREQGVTDSKLVNDVLRGVLGLG